MCANLFQSMSIIFLPICLRLPLSTPDLRHPLPATPECASMHATTHSPRPLSCALASPLAWMGHMSYFQYWIAPQYYFWLCQLSGQPTIARTLGDGEWELRKVESCFIWKEDTQVWFSLIFLWLFEYFTYSNGLSTYIGLFWIVYLYSPEFSFHIFPEFSLPLTLSYA